MKILFVTHFLPYPPNDGGRIGYYNPLKYLSRRHEMVLASIVSPGQESDVAALRPFCAEVVTYEPSPAERRRSLVRAVAGSPPGTAGRYFHPGFGAVLAETVRKHRPDIVEFQHLNTAAYLPYGSGPVPILREHNIEYKVWDRYVEHMSAGPRRWALGAVARRVRQYEAAAAPRFARCVCVSEADESFLREVAPEARVTTIPSGVDAEYFTADESAEQPYSMVLTGSFVWKPKQHNLRRLVSEIFPRIRAAEPRATLAVVGKGVPPELRALAEANGVVVTGMVPDVRPYVRTASLVLNYLEAGGGIALKVLEAFAMRKAVLSNGLGIEGIPGAEAHCAVADDVEQFARTAADLLANAGKRRALAESAYGFVRRDYAWDSLARRFEALYREVLDERADAAPGSRAPALVNSRGWD